MKKCPKCETLYSESAEVCMYCKIALDQPEKQDAVGLDFILHSKVSEQEAEKFKISLMVRGFNCAIVKVENDGLFNVLISEDDKGRVFRIDGGVSDLPAAKSSPRSSFAINLFVMMLFCFLIFGLYFYFNHFKKKDVKEPVTIYEGNVDPRISDRKATMPKKKKVNRTKKIKEKKIKTIDKNKRESKVKPQN